MTRAILVSISCFLIFYKRVFNQFDNIPPQSKDSEVVSVRKMCLISCLKYFKIQMARTFLFRMVLRKFSEITNKKPILSQYNTFYNYEYFLFHSAFWSLFNHRQRSQSNQENSLCSSSTFFLVLLCTHYGSLQCFSTYFRKLKEIGVLRSIFPDYVISCDYD